MMDNNRMIKEVEEAITAADHALTHLYAARDMLKSASGWGMFDMLGGGMFTTFIKRSKMKDAQAEMERAQNALMIFNRELEDVQNMEGIDFDASSFSGIADYVFDHFFVDMFVQGEINEAEEKVEDAIQQVTILLESLEEKEEELVREKRSAK